MMSSNQKAGVKPDYFGSMPSIQHILTYKERRKKVVKLMKDMKNTKTTKNIQITIKQIENRQGEYIAYCRSELLNATYSVYFRDNIFGAIALHDFSEMIKRKYEKEEIEFIISEEKMQFKSKALLGAMSLK